MIRLILCIFIIAGFGLAQEEEEALPRYETEAEKKAYSRMVFQKFLGGTPPPNGPVFCPSEYGPTEAILLSYQGSSSWKTILDQMAAQITTTGDADVYVMVDNASEGTAATTNMTNLGGDSSRFFPLVVPVDSIWIRDYGPRYIYEGGVRAIVDHTYNRKTRVNDNAIPVFFGGNQQQPVYEIPLEHGGGNYHLHDDGDSHTTRLINIENPHLTEQEIHDLWMDFQNVDTIFYEPFPTSVDATQHIDMWMIPIGDQEVIISDWPSNVGSTQDQICDQAAIDLATAGYTVHRIPARSVGGTHYTYTNAVICNDLVLLPTYSNSTVSPHNSEALTVWQNALPSKTVVQVNCQAIVTFAGVMHCIAKHMPAFSGVEDPIAYLRTDLDGLTYEPDQVQTLDWISDDNEQVTEVRILFSETGSEPFQSLATGLPKMGTWNWTIPNTPTTTGRVKIEVEDNLGNTGSFLSEIFGIQGSVCRGDNAPEIGPGEFGDGVIDLLDMSNAYQYWTSNQVSCDIWPVISSQSWGDGIVNIQDLVDLMSLQGNCP